MILYFHISDIFRLLDKAPKRLAPQLNCQVASSGSTSGSEEVYR